LEMMMSRVADFAAVALAGLLFAGGCSSESLNPTGDMPSPSGAGGAAIGVPATGGNGVFGLGGMVAVSGTGGLRGTGGGDAGSPPDAEFCCPPDSYPSGCMHLGGQSYGGMCYVACDFWGSSNWRIETDAHGCPYWRYDYGGACMPPFCIDAGPIYSDAGSGN
jgi:hypothetical protein